MMTMTIAMITKILSCQIVIKTQDPNNKNKIKVNVDSWEFHENVRVAHDRS